MKFAMGVSGVGGFEGSGGCHPRLQLKAKFFGVCLCLAELLCLGLRLLLPMPRDHEKHRYYYEMR